MEQMPAAGPRSKYAREPLRTAIAWSRCLRPLRELHLDFSSAKIRSFERARLQPCRKQTKESWALAPEGV